MSRTLGPIGLVTIGLLGGCSSDSAKPATLAHDAGPTDGATPVEKKFRVLVLDADTKGEKVATNVSVAITPPGGGDVVEAVTDETGVATFDPIDWSKGDVAITTYGDKRILWSLTDINEARIEEWRASHPAVSNIPRPAHEFFLYTLSSGNARPDVALSGKVIGKADPANVALLSSTTSNLVWESVDDSFSLSVERDKSFRLFATEWAPPQTATVSSRGFEGTVIRWAYKEHPALTANTKVDFDFATATQLTPTKFKGKLVIPGGDTGPLGATSTARLVTGHVDSQAQYARYTKMDVTADKSAFEYEGEYVSPPNADLVFTRHLIQRQDGSSSSLSRDGSPVDGETVDGLPLPPAITVSTQPLYDAWAIEGVTATPGALVRAVVGDGHKVLWFVDAFADEKSLTPPKLPEPAAAKIVGTLDGSLGVLSDSNDKFGLFMKGAFGRRFKVTK